MNTSVTRRLLIFIAALAILAFGYRHFVSTGLIPRPSILKSMIPMKAEEITAAPIAPNGNVKLAPLPSSSAVQPCVDGNTRNCVPGPVHEMETWAWNANMPLFLATGGASDGKGIKTSKGSFMEKHGVNVHIVRQDDTGVMQQDLLDTAQRLVSDPNATGIKYVTIMGDGGAQFFEAINPKLAKVCPDCIMKVAGILGRSNGEDGFWGPQAWKDNCEAMRGGVSVGVLRDGDWNIAQKKLFQCQVPNNPDDTVYDPKAMNWVNADSYTKAAEMFVQGYCVDLPVKGRIGGGKQHVCVQGVVTWTPGDVTVAKKKGGVVPILTTKQSAFQMPCILVGISSWMHAHPQDVSGILAASFEAADQIKANPAALQRAGEISAVLYKEENAAYWVKYYRGVTEPDALGRSVPLGGSAVSNLADNLQYFGFSGPSLFAATYTTFGNIVVQQYPNLVPTFPPVAQILDTSYLEAVRASNSLPTDNAEAATTYTPGKPMSSIEGKRDYAIEFRTGSAEILQPSIPMLDQIVNDVLITKYAVAIHGHTDNTGTAEGNMSLSQARAQSVRQYIDRKGQFPEGRVRVYAHGSEDPVGSNDTAEGRSRNRRVEIVLGTVN